MNKILSSAAKLKLKDELVEVGEKIHGVLNDHNRAVGAASIAVYLEAILSRAIKADAIEGAAAAKAKKQMAEISELFVGIAMAVAMDENTDSPTDKIKPSDN